MLRSSMFGHANPLTPLLATHPRISSKTHTRQLLPPLKTQELTRPRASRPSSGLLLSPLFATHPKNALVSPLVATHFQKNRTFASPSDSLPRSHSGAEREREQIPRCTRDDNILDYEQGVLVGNECAGCYEGCVLSNQTCQVTGPARSSSMGWPASLRASLIWPWW